MSRETGMLVASCLIWFMVLLLLAAVMLPAYAQGLAALALMSFGGGLAIGWKAMP